MSNPSPLITVQALAERLQQRDSAVLVVDCSFDLTDASAGQRLYEAGHLPGAVYAHLEEVLSGPKNGRNGRHPLPGRAGFVSAMASLGASDDTLVVAYDQSGSMYAARLWWMLRWVGHAAVCVLDGGLPAWKAVGLPVEQGAAQPRPSGSLTEKPSLVAQVSYEDVTRNLSTGHQLVVDARAPDRFRGENETLDPIGGHIPGAVNRLFRDNLQADGRFKPAEELRAQFDALLQGRQPKDVINQCGSGVTACHNLLAMEHAGLSGAALYPGSWSEWSAQPGAPIAR